MNSIKVAVGIVLLMAISYTVGYCAGEHNTNTKWQIEQAKNWKPVIG
jgi:hypothetical protein